MRHRRVTQSESCQPASTGLERKNGTGTFFDKKRTCPVFLRPVFLRRGGVLRRALVAIVLAGILIGAWLWWGLHTPPSWYDVPDVTVPEVTALADRVELRVLEEATAERDADALWGVRITDEQVNAWLAAKLRPWLEHEGDVDWPAELGPPQMHFEPKGINFAVEVLEGELAGRIVVLRLTPVIDAEGQLRLTLNRVALGRIGLLGNAMESLVGLLRDNLDESLQKELALALELAGGERAIDPSIALADDRLLVLEAIRLGEGEAFLTCRTLPPVPRRAEQLE